MVPMTTMVIRLTMNRELYIKRIKNAYECSYRCTPGSWGRMYWNTVIDKLHRNYWKGVEDLSCDTHR